MFIVGLTGGIGSGKSIVGNHFSKLGISVIDADLAARKVVEKGSPALCKIADHFGPESLLSDGKLNRAYLRSRIFDSPQERAWLEALLHPQIKTYIQHEIQQASSLYVILESPLLLETDQYQLTDRILVVDVPEELQVVRASERDKNNEQQIRAIMQAQLSREERLNRADDILDNSGPTDHIEGKVWELHQRYMELAREKDDHQ